MSEPLCAVCGEDHDYDAHKQGAELERKSEPEPAVAANGWAGRWKCVAKSLYAQRALWEKCVDHALDAIHAEPRAEKAEADAALAWRRVTELQARGTELVLERRAHEARLAECVRSVRQLLRCNRPSYVEEVLVEYDGPYRPMHEQLLEMPEVKLDALLLDLEAWRQKWNSVPAAAELADIVAKYEAKP